MLTQLLENLVIRALSQEIGEGRGSAFESPEVEEGLKSSSPISQESALNTRLLCKRWMAPPLVR